MASRRAPRPLRWLLLVALLALLALLLEFHRFLPGVWPGGGGDAGLRPTPSGTARDPTAVRPSVEPAVPTAPGATALVLVAPPSGASGAPATLTVRRGGRSTTASLVEGRATLPAGDAAVEGFSLESDGRRLVHGPPPPNLGTTVRLHWPRSTLPEVPATAPPAVVRVEDGDGRPLAGAAVSWVAGGREGRVVTDAAGEARVVDPPLPQVRLCAVAPGHGEVCVYGSVAAPGPIVIRLPRLVRRATTFVDDASGEAVRPVTLRLVTPEGAPKTISRPEQGYDHFDLTVPSDLAERASVEAETPGRPTVRVALTSMGARTAVPAGRSLSVRVRDASGTPAAGVSVTARYAPRPDPESQDEGALASSARTDSDGRATLGVPAGIPTDLLVEPAGLAPTGVRVAADATGDVTVALERGVALDVRVADPSGAPVAGARVLCLARAGSAEVRREARTDARGLATLPPVAAGRVEVLAHAPGHAWASATTEAREGAPALALTLQPGRRLHLVVEDPWGVPVEGVRVQAVPRPDAGGQGPDAGDPDAVPWRTDAHGVLDVPDQPARSLDLHLHRDGYDMETLPDVRPGDVTWYATLVPTRR